VINKKSKLRVVTSKDALRTPLRTETDAGCCVECSKQIPPQSLMTHSTVVVERDQQEEQAIRKETMIKSNQKQQVQIV
jgi:hypothetical protein